MIILEEVITKDGPFIKVEDLLRKYENRCIEKGFGPNDEYDMQSLLDMLSILVTDGVTDQVCFLSLINYRQLQIEFYKDWLAYANVLFWIEVVILLGYMLFIENLEENMRLSATF